MGGPGNTSSDILGIEVGRRVVRGVRLDQETTELTAAAECPLDSHAISADGVIDPVAVGPALDQVIDLLGVQDRTLVRVGFTIGPRNAGVGSGPSMAAWLEAQAMNLQEPMICSGGLGISFVPTRAVDAALKLASGSGIDLVRIDLAPVAGARAIGDQVEDIICMGSGRGWQARMRDFEVLEAMENVEIGDDDPLAIAGPSGPTRSIARYGWVEISPQLDQAQRLDISQLAPAVGVAIGVAYESPANLLLGKDITCGPAAKPAPGYGLDPSDYDLAPQAGEQTLQLGSKVTIDHAFGQHEVRSQRPELTVVPDPVQHPEPATPQPMLFAEPASQPAAAPVPAPIEEIEPAARPAAPQRLAPLRPADRGDLPLPRGQQSSAEDQSPAHSQRVAPPRTGLSPLTTTAERAAVADRSADIGRSTDTGRSADTGRAAINERASAGPWNETVDESDPITMFSPDTEVRHMMGKRETRFNLDVVFVLLLISAIALLVVYRYL